MIEFFNALLELHLVIFDSTEGVDCATQQANTVHRSLMVHPRHLRPSIAPNVVHVDALVEWHALIVTIAPTSHE